MENNNPPSQCPICQSAIKRVPAGISKRTGKPYSEFWSCVNRDCGFTWRPEKKGTKQTPMKEYDQGERILDALRKVYVKIDSLEKELKDFMRIFIDKQKGE